MRFLRLSALFEAQKIIPNNEIFFLIGLIIKESHIEYPQPLKHLVESVEFISRLVRIYIFEFHLGGIEESTAAEH